MMLAPATPSLHRFGGNPVASTASTSRAAAVRMSDVSDAVVKKRGLPPGEDDGAAKPPVVGRIEALDFLGLSDDEKQLFLRICPGGAR